MTEPERDPFVELIAELSDGKQWAILRAEGFDDFVERLTAIIGSLEPRRRQAVVMLLFGLVEGFVAPEQAEAWMRSHDIDSDEGVGAMIVWLRGRRHQAD